MSHKTTNRKRLRRLRRDARTRENAQPVGYDDGDQIVVWQGDKDAPYVKLVGPEHGDPDLATDPQKVGGHANAALRAAVDEDDMVDASFDLQGRLRVVSSPGAAVTVADALSWVNALAVFQAQNAVPCIVYKLFMQSSSGVVSFVQLFDQVAAVAGGETPLQTWRMDPFETLSFDFGGGLPFANGVVAAFSSSLYSLSFLGGGEISIGYRNI